MSQSFVYHTASESNKKQILRDGLQANAYSQSTLPADNIAEQDGWYFYPASTQQSKLDYANSLILTILEQKRPASFPKHHDCQFFFPTLDLVGELNRSVVFEVETIAFEDHPVYQADFKIAEQLFFDTLREFEIGDEVKKSSIHTLAEKYWNSATKLSSFTTARNTAELLIPIENVDPEYITIHQSSIN